MRSGSSARLLSQKNNAARLAVGGTPTPANAIAVPATAKRLLNYYSENQCPTFYWSVGRHTTLPSCRGR